MGGYIVVVLKGKCGGGEYMYESENTVCELTGEFGADYEKSEIIIIHHLLFNMSDDSIWKMWDVDQGYWGGEEGGWDRG